MKDSFKSVSATQDNPKWERQGNHVCRQHHRQHAENDR